jgi:hypothetical protein
MRAILLLLLISSSRLGYSLPNQSGDKNITTEDSIKIANSALGFYNWYIGCLNDNKTYNIVQPLYSWKDTTAILLIEPYLKKLIELNVVSEHFVDSEKRRFKICQDSLNKLSYKKVQDCGCSVGEFFTECSFIDYFYWISSQENYNGCEVKEIKIRNDLATCQLVFYYDSELSNGKQIDENFKCKLFLKRTNTIWLIESIERKRN